MFRGLIVIGLVVVFVIVFAFFSPSKGGNAAVAGPPAQGGLNGNPPLPKVAVRKQVSPEEREEIGLDEPTWVSAHGKVHPDVYAALKKDERPWPRRVGFEGTVYVDVHLRHEQRGERTSEENQAAVKEVQAHVLSRMTAAEFSVMFQFKSTPGLVGYASAEGLAKLAKDPDVIAVGLDDKPIPRDPPPVTPDALDPPKPGEKRIIREPVEHIGKVEAAVYDALEKSADGCVFVVIPLKKVQPRKPTREQQNAAVKKLGHRVLSKVSAEEFRLRSRTRTFASLTGYANAAGLAKLDAHPDVVGIGLTRRIRVPGVHGTKPVWNR